MSDTQQAATGANPSETVIRDVVSEVALREGVGPLDLPPLYDAVDLDALDGLLTGGSITDGAVTFRYCGYDVTIDADRNVTVGDGRERSHR